MVPLLDKVIEGFGELFRVLSFETIGMRRDCCEEMRTTRYARKVT